MLLYNDARILFSTLGSCRSTTLSVISSVLLIDYLKCTVCTMYIQVYTLRFLFLQTAVHFLYSFHMLSKYVGGTFHDFDLSSSSLILFCSSMSVSWRSGRMTSLVLVLARYTSSRLCQNLFKLILAVKRLLILSPFLLRICGLDFAIHMVKLI